MPLKVSDLDLLEVEAVTHTASQTDDRSRDLDGLLLTREAALYLRLSPRTLERLRVSGAGPRFLKAGRGIRARVLYRQSDLAQWLSTHEFSSTSEYGQATDPGDGNIDASAGRHVATSGERDGGRR